MNTTESETTTTEENAGTASKPQAEAAGCKGKSSICCRPHTSLLVACIAIVIAIYALVAGHNRTAEVQVQGRLSNIEEQVVSINTQLNKMGADVKRNRENLIHTKLQKALENVQEIGQMATTNTRAKLAEIEAMLHDIITPAAEKASTSTSTSTSSSSSSSSSISTSAETPANPDTQAASNEAPAAVTTPTETATPAPTTTTTTTAAPDNTTAQQPTETAPSTPSVTTPAAQQPATTAPDATKSSKPATQPHAL